MGQNAPNVLLILIDDAGNGVPGTFGGVSAGLPHANIRPGPEEWTPGRIAVASVASVVRAGAGVSNDLMLVAG